MWSRTDKQRLKFGSSLWPWNATSDASFSPQPEKPTMIHPTAKFSSILIGLPPSASIPHAIVKEEPVRPGMSIGEMVERLAKQFNVNETRWELVVFSDDRAPYILNKDEKIDRFVNNKKQRLYFYPSSMIR